MTRRAHIPVAAPTSGWNDTEQGWVLPLPFTRPLSLNDRMHWGQRSRETKAWRDAGHVLARKHRVPLMDRWTVVLHYAPRDERQRDVDNLVATLKACTDGIRDHTKGQDTHEHYQLTSPAIHPATGEPGRLWVIVRDLGGKP